ncbi:MAG: tRNA preQ1(34) S-adenosylmethionine ribosyltransferase-isomerase QueA [Acidimicrobiia bacterium]|nr:tRNA preQ1(34) S-adenosylmethionine ribosyltransferase-isomerase QueA [Acidimicrobiia bacterium]
MRTADFAYDLPADAIAQEPAEPRDSSRLLDCRDMTDHRFAELPSLLDEGDLVVVNRTRVRRARLRGARQDTGGAVELLLLRRIGEVWSALAKPSRRLRPGVAIEAGRLRVTVVGEPVDGVIDIELSTVDGTRVEEAIEEQGEVPLPPYFSGTLSTPERYQTIFAQNAASAAAPTAGLHFTESVVSGLGDRGIAIAEVDLEVGLDTFRPMSTDDVADHEIHTERVEVSGSARDAIAATRRRGGRVIAIGTTVVRALESSAAGLGQVSEFVGDTDLFITPGYEFRVVDGLITNFHVPSSTLVVLVAAFMGEAWRQAYSEALARGYRMLSFGDAMMVFR